MRGRDYEGNMSLDYLKKLNDRYEKNLVLAVLGMISAIFINNFFSELLETDKIGSLFYMGVTLLVVYDIKSFKRTA